MNEFFRVIADFFTNPKTDLIKGILGGEIASWIVAHLYYMAGNSSLKKLNDNISADVKEIILNSKAENLSVKELNMLLQDKIFDDNSKGDPLPYKSCRICGSEDLERGSTFNRDDLWYHIKCNNCEWSDASE